jgi:isopenicillin-N epimerase
MDIHTAENLRSQFLLDNSVIYLNHGSFGATPLPVFESYQRWQRELEAQPTEFLGRRASGLMATARRSLADYLGTSADNLVYVSNATVGLNVVARSLKIGPSDEVLATNHEYGALDRTWRFLAKKQGFTYTNQAISLPVESKECFIEQLWRGVTSRTRVIFISHITSPTALIFPVEEICRRAREEGILTVIDGAHAPGQIPLILDNLGADFYSGNLHKWLCAPKGAGFLYARSEMIPTIEPLVVSWGYKSENPSDSQLVDYVEWQGTRDISAFLAVPDAIAFQEEHAWETVRDRCHALTVETIQRICAISGQPPFSPLSREWFVQMSSAPLPPQTDALALKQALYDQFRIEIPILEWNGHILARCSFQGYNTPADAEALIEALGQLLKEM